MNTENPLNIDFDEVVSRREFFLKVAISATSGAIVGLGASYLLLGQDPKDVVEGTTTQSTPTNKPDELKPTNRPGANETVQPGSTQEISETSIPTEAKPKEYEFKIGEVKLANPFFIVVPGDIAKDLGYPKGMEISINMPLINRSKIGWEDEVTIPFEQYKKNKGAALIAQSDISGHDVIILHSFSTRGKLLPGEVFRRVKDREKLVGKEFSLRQENSGVEVESKLKVVDITKISGEVFESSDAKPSNTTDPQKFVFFRSDMWNLTEGELARQPNQITFITCDGRFVEDNVSKFASRLLITAELIR